MTVVTRRCFVLMVMVTVMVVACVTITEPVLTPEAYPFRNPYISGLAYSHLTRLSQRL